MTSRAEWAQRIRDGLTGAVGGIIQAGADLVAARAELNLGVSLRIAPDGKPEPKHTHDTWVAFLFECGLKEATALKLMSIARNPVLADVSHWEKLPAQWTTLYELSKLPEQAVLDYLTSGKVHARVTRGDVTRLAKGVPAPPEEPAGEEEEPAEEEAPALFGAEAKHVHAHKAHAVKLAYFGGHCIKCGATMPANGPEVGNLCEDIAPYLDDDGLRNLIDGLGEAIDGPAETPAAPVPRPVKEADMSRLAQTLFDDLDKAQLKELHTYLTDRLKRHKVI